MEPGNWKKYIPPYAIFFAEAVVMTMIMVFILCFKIYMMMFSKSESLFVVTVCFLLWISKNSIQILAKVCSRFIGGIHKWPCLNFGAHQRCEHVSAGCRDKPLTGILWTVLCCETRSRGCYCEYIASTDFLPITGEYVNHVFVQAVRLYNRFFEPRGLGRLEPLLPRAKVNRHNWRQQVILTI